MATVGLKPPAAVAGAGGGPRRRSVHTRTVTRFCDDANIEENDQIDMAEFIVAAHYLGVDASNDELMEAFMEIEDALEESEKVTKEKIKEFVAKVEDMYGSKKMEGAEADDDEIMEADPLGIFAEDQKWQDNQLSGMLNEAYEDQQLAVAHKLLDTTALSVEQISEITGVPAATLETYIEDYDSSDDEDDALPLPKSEQVKMETLTDPSAAAGAAASSSADGKPALVKVPSGMLQKSLALTTDDIALLDELCASGPAKVAEKSAQALDLLKKLKFGVEMTKTGQRRMKSAMRLRTQILSSADISKVVADAVSKEESRFPAKYRVIIHPGALVKAKETLASAEVAKIKIGVVVTVEEIKDRRARISTPVEGWCSVTSGDGRTILQKEGTRSKEMAKAIQEERGRKTKILILKSVTTLNDTTVERILEKSQWNLRRAIDAFYMTKYQTQMFIRKEDAAGQESKKLKPTDSASKKRRLSKTEDVSVETATGTVEGDLMVGAKGDTSSEPLVAPGDSSSSSKKRAKTPGAKKKGTGGGFWRSWKLFSSQN